MSDKKKPQYQTIIDDILGRIRDRALKPGDKIPTDHELMEIYGVSRITVTRAINELVQRGIVYRVKKRGSFIREPMEQPAPGEQLPLGKLPILSVVLPFDERYGYDILRGVEQTCRESGYYMTFHCSGNEPEKEREILMRLQQDGVSGIIVYPHAGPENIGVYSDMLIRDIPFVLIDRQIEGIESASVLTDNSAGMYGVVSHLVELGHQRIAYVGLDPQETGSVKERFKGYCQALIDGGIPLRREYIVDARRVDAPIIGTEWPELAQRLLGELLALPEPPTAIAAVNDVTAVQFMKAAAVADVPVPGRLSITGFDNLPFCEHLEVPLTTVEQQFFEFGSQAARMIIDGSWKRDGGLMTKRLTTRLIVRKSSAPPF